MKQAPRIGSTGEKVVEVAPGDCITFADDRMPSVLSTPSLIGFLEHAARDAVGPFLEDHERSVGVLVEVEHLAPTPIGRRVVCRARVIHVDEPVVTFRLEAYEGKEAIARGLHKRRVIDVDRFARRVRKKAEGS